VFVAYEFVVVKKGEVSITGESGFVLAAQNKCQS